MTRSCSSTVSAKVAVSPSRRPSIAHPIAAASPLRSQADQGPESRGMKRFYLQRDVDETGNSGTGRVAEGVVFSNGWVAMTWLGSITSLVFYPRLSDVEAIHGH